MSTHAQLPVRGRQEVHVSRSQLLVRICEADSGRAVPSGVEGRQRGSRGE
jgi:hypothetical protein